MSEFTFLEEEQIFGDKALDIIKKYGTKAKITDLAVIRGGYLNSDEGTGYYWTKDQYDSTSARVVVTDGDRYRLNVSSRFGGCRPALPYSSIQSICSNVVRDSDGIPTVMCGEYPQRAVGVKMQYVLNTECNNGRLNKTGKNYTFDSRKYNDYNNGFSPEVYDEYEYQGKKYIRVKVNSHYDRETFQLPQSNWSCKDGDYIWIEVSPVEWIVDEKADLAIAKNILVAGIRYDDGNKYDGNFENTEMYKYLNKYMVHDLFQGIQPVMKFETMTEEPEQKVEPEVVEPIEPIEQPIIEKPHRSIFDFFRRKNKVNPNYVSVLKSELDTLSYDILFNVPDGPEKDMLNARFDWVMDYYNNNFNRLNDDKQDLEDLLFREKLNDLTLDVKLSIEKSNENIQKRI